MTVRGASYLSGGAGLLSLAVMWVGLDSFAGLLLLVQLGALVGAPLAIVLRGLVRSWSVTIVMSSATSLALSSLAAQSLIWFEFANGPAVVALATVYGLTIAALVPKGGPGYQWDLSAVGCSHQKNKTGAPKAPAGTERWWPVGLAVAVCGTSLALVGGFLVDSDRVGGYGIISAFPAVYWIGLVLTAIGSLVLLDSAAQGGNRFVSAVPVAWLLVLHTAPALAHESVRFNIVWTHMGFVRFVDTSSTADVMIDARFAWPGLFAALAPSLPRLHPQMLDVLLRLWPTLVTASAMILVAALARRSYPTTNLIGTVSTLVYAVLAWTGQDYFSPQSVGFVWFLCLLVLIEAGPLRIGSSVSAAVPILSRMATAGGDRPISRSTAGFVVLLILSFGAIVSHPLAPFFVCTGLLTLGVYGRAGAWRLLIVVSAGYLSWVAIAARPWWSTRLPELTGQLGRVISNLRASTSERVAMSSPEHLLVTNVRSVLGIATFVAVLVIGVVMSRNQFRHLRPAIPLAPLAGIPVLALALQSYGGEIVIRVLLFSLPAAAILFARAVARLPDRTRAYAITAIVVAMTPLFLMARFGNEAFEMTTAEDRAVIESAYAVASDDTLFVADNGFISWRDQMIGEATFVELPATASQSWLDQIDRAAELANKSQVIVVFTPSQAAWRQYGQSKPGNSLDEIGAWLAELQGSTLLYQEGQAWAVQIESGS